MYIEQRRRRWYALHDIPADVRTRFGKARFKQSLETADKEVAKRRAAVLEGKWRADIERARKQGGALGSGRQSWRELFMSGPDGEFWRRLFEGSPEGDAEYWRGVYLAAPEEEREGVRERIRDEAQDRVLAAAVGAGVLDHADPKFEELPQQREARQFVALATGETARTDEHVEEYLATLRVAAKTLDIKRMNLTRFTAKFPFTGEVTRREVQRWVNELGAAGKAAKTLQRDLSDMRGYWRYLQALQIVPEDVQPLRDLVLPKADKNGERRRPFEAGEVVKLWRHAAGPWADQELADLIELGMWTGCRIEELCALKVEHVSKDAFRVVDAKTNAGLREVPVHKELAATMARLVKASKDGFVLSGLTLNKYGDRSNAIGKRFGRLKAELGFGPEHVFHSVRKTVSTLLENAKVPENISADILGHEKKTMTYGLYSGGASLKVKAQALAKLKYPV